MRRVDGSWECSYCATPLDTAGNELRVTMHVPEQAPAVRVLELDGVELHRCNTYGAPTKANVWEELAWEREARD
jgi:hypothetical protein